MRKEYNVRLIIDGDKIELSFVSGLYSAKPISHRGKKIPVKQWKSVPDSIKKRIAKKIGAECVCFKTI